MSETAAAKSATHPVRRSTGWGDPLKWITEEAFWALESGGGRTVKYAELRRRYGKWIHDAETGEIIASLCLEKADATRGPVSQDTGSELAKPTGPM